MAGGMSRMDRRLVRARILQELARRESQGPATGTYRVIRGGAWSDPPAALPSSSATGSVPRSASRTSASAAPRTRRAADQRIKERIAAFQGTVSLYAKNLNSGAEFAIRADDRVRTASTIKLPILVAVFQAVADGKATWDEELLLTEDDKVAGSGILREFSAGRKYLLRDLANLMIVVSDNTATNLLLDRFTADYVNTVMEKYGFQFTAFQPQDPRRRQKSETESHRPQRLRPRRKRTRNSASASPRPAKWDASLRCSTKARSSTPEASKAMIAILRRQQHTDGIGRHLEGFRVASKSGSLDALRSDVGLVIGKTEKYAIAITVDAMPKTDYSADNAGSILISDSRRCCSKSSAKSPRAFSDPDLHRLRRDIHRADLTARTDRADIPSALANRDSTGVADHHLRVLQRRDQFLIARFQTPIKIRFPSAVTSIQVFSVASMFNSQVAVRVLVRTGTTFGVSAALSSRSARSCSGGG